MNMRRIHITFYFVLITCSNIFAQNNGFGGGVILGEPTGFSAKLWLDDNSAADFGFGYSFFPNDKRPR